MRSTACGVPFEVLDAGQIEYRFGIRADPGDRGLFQADGGILLADAALARSPRRLELRERVRVRAVDEDGDGVVAGGSAGARRRGDRRGVGTWARRRRRHAHGGDRLLLRPRPARAVRDRHDDRTALGLRARGSGRSIEGGAAPVRPADRPRCRGRPRSGALGADGGLDRAPLPRGGPAGAVGDLPLHDPPRTTSSCSSGAAGSSSARACSGHGFKFAPAVGKRLARSRRSLAA